VTCPKLFCSGEYQGKVVKRKDYLKIKASGYAWEVSNAEGIVSYIDGAGHKASNWLKFVNCCRGKCSISKVYIRTIYAWLFVQIISI